jgi:hypothetical protein
MCEYDIRLALESVEYNKWLRGAMLSRSAHKKKLQRYAKKLRAVEALESTFVGTDIGPDCMARLKFVLRCYEQTADAITLRHGSRRLSASKECATICAYALLVKFGPHPPGLTRGGPWDNLARTLYGAEQADLFHYLMRFSGTPLYKCLRARTGVPTAKRIETFDPSYEHIELFPPPPFDFSRGVPAQQPSHTAENRERYPGCCKHIVFGPSTRAIIPAIVV